VSRACPWIFTKEDVMDYLEALNMALKKEEEAVKMYRQFSIKHPAIKNLFEFLMDDEQKHVSLIEKKISELYK
jgi:rubrerythrin